MQTLILKNRGKAAAFENLHVVKTDQARNSFRWEMVEGIGSLADKEPELGIPIEPIAVLD